MQWTVKETEASSYSIRDWDFASRWNDEEKSFSFHLSFHLSSHEELEWSKHHLNSVDDNEMNSSQSHLTKAKIFNALEEVSWQNHKKA